MTAENSSELPCICMCICYTPPYPFYQGTATGDQLVSPERTKISRQAVRPAQLRGKLGCPSACPAERCLPRGKRADPSLLGLSQAKHHFLSLQSFHSGFHSPSLHPPPPSGHPQGPFRSWRPCPLRSGISVNILSYLLWCVCFTCQALQGRLISLIS